MTRTCRHLALAIALSWSFGGCSHRHFSSDAPAFAVKADVTAKEAKAMMDRDRSIRYLDVRTVREFEAGHPAAALNIPVIIVDKDGNRQKNPDFLKNAQSILAKDQKIIVGCRSGSRSKLAQKLLREAGFSNVINMLGGYNGGRDPDGKTAPGWSQLGFPTEKGSGD